MKRENLTLGAGALVMGILQGSFNGTGFGWGVRVTDQWRAVLSKASLLLTSPTEKATSLANNQEIGGEGKIKD